MAIKEGRDDLVKEYTLVFLDTDTYMVPRGRVAVLGRSGWEVLLEGVLERQESVH